MSDEVNMHVQVLGEGASGKWVAIRLEDGGSDHQLYDTRRDAIRHQRYERECCYVCVPPFGTMMGVREAESFLVLHRSMYQAGYRLEDPADPAPIHPLIQVAAPRRGSKYAYAWKGEWK
jgi:hypothetical protein